MVMVCSTWRIISFVIESQPYYLMFVMISNHEILKIGLRMVGVGVCRGTVYEGVDG